MNWWTSLSKQDTTHERLLGVLLLTLLTLAITFVLPPVADSQLAGGAAIAIVILGLSWLTGWSGQISLGNSGFMAVGAYAAGIWAHHHSTTPLIFTFVLAVVVGGFSGLIVAIPSTRLRGPYLAGMTLAFSAAVTPLAQNFTSVTGGEGGIFMNSLVTPKWFTHFFSGQNAAISANAQWTADLAIVTAGVAFFFMANLFHSRSGRAMRLVRDNDVAAELMGVNLARTRSMAFVVSAAFAGLGGALYSLLEASVRPETFPLTLSITLLTLMVLGGIGTLSGAVIGGIIYSFSANLVAHVNSLTGVNPTSNLGANMQGIIFGVLLILTMLFAPRGLVSLTNPIRRLLRARPHRATANEVD
ncbi:MAG TPA: branched-chain amino acid ABC transporter permease [Acidimicrobiales bacterium]|nr:branched-chain amino acid ABC transporter permease [Acidimicrobiales bacterium]